MRRTLYIKFLLGYLVFGALCFIAVVTLASSLTTRYLENSYEVRLYDQATYLQRLYRDLVSHFDPESDAFSSFTEQVSLVCDYNNCDAWIISGGGISQVAYSNTGNGAGVILEDFGTSTSLETDARSTFYGYYPNEVISSMCTVVRNNSIECYIVLHTPLSTVLETRDTILHTTYLVVLIVYMLSFILLVIFRNTVAVPLKKITKAANEYAEGNLKYDINFYSEDEMGYLAGTLNYMAKELSNTEEYQRKFIANISHDFRSPLTNIKGYLVAMIDGTIPEESYHKYMNLVISETERLTTLTTSTLALKSLESKGTYLEMSDFDINRVVKDTAMAFEGSCRSKEIFIDLIFINKEQYVHADKSKIQQVFYNLIDNAVKFSHNNSVITVKTYIRKTRVFVSVKDTGIGIPKGSLKFIWDRFYKTDLSRGKDKKGSGLGLSIAKEIIQAHEQIIDVISTEGVGTEFVFSLQKVMEAVME